MQALEANGGHRGHRARLLAMPDAPILSDCGRRPNCVSSNASNPSRRVGPWRLSAAPEVAWQAVRELVAATPRTTIVKEEPWYLRAEARSRLLRFVDDLELALDPEQGLLSVRSASRVGYSDRGVNRRRVERLRSLLAERQVIESPVIES